MPTYIVTPRTKGRTVNAERQITSLSGVTNVERSRLTGDLIVTTNSRKANELRSLNTVGEVREERQYTPDTADPEEMEKFLEEVREGNDHDPLLPGEPEREREEGDAVTDGAGVSLPRRLPDEMEANPDDPGELSGADDTLEHIGSRDLHEQGFDGAGVICVDIDTGVCGGQIADERKLGGMDLKDGDTPWDDYMGHGSYTTGLMAGGTATNGLEVGAAPAADVFAIRTSLAESELLKAHDKVSELAEEYDRPVVVNNSYGLGVCGGNCAAPVARAAAQAARIDNVVEVFSAGNAGGSGDDDCGTGCNENSISSASAKPPTFTVAATGLRGDPSALMPYSTRGGTDVCGGRKPNLSCPIYGTVPYGCGKKDIGNVGGTSGAAPQVAGIFAQLLSEMSADQVPTTAELYKAFHDGCADLSEPGGSGWDGCTGFGNVNGPNTRELMGGMNMFPTSPGVLGTRSRRSVAASVGAAGLATALSFVSRRRR